MQSVGYKEFVNQFRFIENKKCGKMISPPAVDMTLTNLSVTLNVFNCLILIKISCQRESERLR